MRTRIVWILAVAVMLCDSVALASNGLQLPGYGDATIGMGGAGIALPQDALAAANNPAGMAFIAQRADAYAHAFEKFLSGTAASTGITIGGSLNYFVIGYGVK